MWAWSSGICAVLLRLAALPIYKEARLPAISPASTNISLGKMSPYYFRNVYRDDFQGAFPGANMPSEIKGYKKVAVFYEMNDYSMGLMKAFVDEAQKSGMSAFWEKKPTPRKPRTSNPSWPSSKS